MYYLQGLQIFEQTADFDKETGNRTVKPVGKPFEFLRDATAKLRQLSGLDVKSKAMDDAVAKLKKGATPQEIAAARHAAAKSWAAKPSPQKPATTAGAPAGKESS